MAPAEKLCSIRICRYNLWSLVTLQYIKYNEFMCTGCINDCHKNANVLNKKDGYLTDLIQSSHGILIWATALFPEMVNIL